MIIQIIVDNYVDNRVDNVLIIHSYPQRHFGYMDIHRFIQLFLATFPRNYDEKRYKLTKFAPKYGIVDKSSSGLKIST